MKRVFGVKKEKEPPPSVGDASERVLSLSLYSSSLFPKAIVGYLRIRVGVIRFLLFFRLLGKNPGFFNLFSFLAIICLDW